jgi:hypothetical protein
MAKSQMKMIEQYIAASLKVGRFVKTSEIEKFDVIDYTSATVNNKFGGINSLRFMCMCEVAKWNENDIEGFYKEYNLHTEFNKNSFDWYR